MGSNIGSGPIQASLQGFKMPQQFGQPEGPMTGPLTPSSGQQGNQGSGMGLPQGGAPQGNTPTGVTPLMPIPSGPAASGAGQTSGMPATSGGASSQGGLGNFGAPKGNPYGSPMGNSIGSK